MGLRCYEPVWTMVHKLRKAMGQRDDRYTLEGMIEMDEGYLLYKTQSKLIRLRRLVGERGSKKDQI